MSLNPVKLQLRTINTFLHFVLLRHGNQTNVVLVASGFCTLLHHLDLLWYLTDSIYSTDAAMQTFIPVSAEQLK